MIATNKKYAWFLDIAPTQMVSLNDNPIPGKSDYPSAKDMVNSLHEVVLYDKLATEFASPEHCWVCTE